MIQIEKSASQLCHDVRSGRLDHHTGPIFLHTCGPCR